MFLKRLEISGFKSFAAKSALDFSFSKNGKKGITAIVGPNGSGKSNIADAARWAMGEQSMKNLRGKKSEDIIFAGSGKKARLGSAHATLYFDNSDKRIPIEFEEVAIARKIFRSGESEYQINGSRVRLQDVVDLLAKAGIGRESYCVINQGMADAVLSASPLERRTVIEDAAGVKHYQIKKERSIRKLELTKENLEKVESIIEEIKPHLRTLKRQADKVSQSEEVYRDLKNKQTKLFTFLWHNLRSEKEKLNAEKEEAGRKMMHIQRETDRLTDEISREAKGASADDKLSHLEKDQREQREKLHQWERELVVTEGRLQIEKERAESARIIKSAEAGNTQVDIKYVQERIDEIFREQERLMQKIQQAEKIEDIQGIKETALIIRQKLSDLKREVDSGQKSAEAEISKEPVSSPVIVEFQKKLDQIRMEIKTIEQEISRLAEEIKKEITLDREKRHKFFESERELRLKQDELSGLKDKFNEIKINLAKEEVREEDLRSEVQRELKINVEELKNEAESVDRNLLEQEISRLKVKVEQIGGIDPMVIDEYKETKERFDFLSKESDDLKKAIVALKEIIKEMEQKIRAEFDSTFEEINKEFTKYFRIIFSGGNANLAKIKVKSRKVKISDKEALLEGEETAEEESVEENPEEEEEIGIDIFACPPGKRIIGLAMLSGGERALTSLALLFAIISHNPPPFAILDEVEAALDEANSRRFGRIITELSGHTQFIIITHNRETMRNASLLYGVTMGEDGISKLLSVSLDQVGQGGKIYPVE
ncbi:MAG: AAA family ATPase [Candidatus Moranbacteria bacterium]|nr:AAA family ATPase [Candidatus Moranbacteria bacterium]